MNDDNLKLSQFLETAPIPKVRKQPKTFLGIARQPHYENVISNIYAFYFDTNEVHGLEDLFINSLIELIKETRLKEKGDFFEGFSDYDCETEYTTNMGGRIDLLLKNEEQAMLIENKIYHHLNNNLKDYWDTLNFSDQNKIGIVLSLHPITKIKHDDFINITHLALLNKVMSNVGNYLLQADSTYLVFLKDLYQNIINISTKTMKNKDIDFYKKHRNEIHNVARFLKSFKEHVKRETEIACDILNEDEDVHFLTLGGKSNNRLRYFISSVNPNLMITVVFDSLYLDNQKNIRITVELQGNILKNRNLLKQIDFNDKEIEIIKPNFYSETNTGWAHFAEMFYPIENIDLENLSEFIARKIREDNLLSVFKKLGAFLSKSNISI